MAKKDDNLITAFRCSRTGLYFPGDFVEEWGKKYGIGLGPVPVSEALVNSYDMAVAEADGKNHEAMHPLAVCKAQVDLVRITQEEFDSNAAILDHEDRSLIRRAELMREKQVLKSSKMAARFPELVAKAKGNLIPIS
jgi:hypothetical protein